MRSAVQTAALVVFLTGCASNTAEPPPTAGARAVINTDTPRPTIDMVDVPSHVLRDLGGIESRDAWSAIMKVSVGPEPEQPAMVGQYEIVNGLIRFTPMFPLDRGRNYHVTFTAPGAQPATAVVSLPAPDRTPTTTVTQVFPSSELVPENQLRLYIQFSSPMGSRGGLDFVHLLDDAGQKIVDPFLPLDAEFFNEDRTRYTVFFDPARHKRGALPAGQTGRSLTEGRTYTVVIDTEWRDGNGLPLKEPFRKTFNVGPPDQQPLDPQAWKITAPAAGTMGPLVVIFPEPLDQGLLVRALGVLAPGAKPLDGQVSVGAGELTWSFAPAAAWQPGSHNIFALAMLADLAGNGIGRAFDADRFDRADTPPESERTLIPFVIK